MVNRENLIEFLVNFNKIDSSAVLIKKIEKDATRLLLSCSKTGSMSTSQARPGVNSDYSFLTP